MEWFVRRFSDVSYIWGNLIKIPRRTSSYSKGHVKFKLILKGKVVFEVARNAQLYAEEEYVIYTE